MKRFIATALSVLFICTLSAVAATKNTDKFYIGISTFITHPALIAWSKKTEFSTTRATGDSP
ncbi:hypothetical protein RsTz2092_13600 [Deferribacterales bacterium RsTz2092]